MSNANTVSPKSRNKPGALRSTRLSTVLDVFSSWRVIPALMTVGVAVGTWLGLTSQHGEIQVVEAGSLDKALVQEVRAALPTTQNGAEAGALTKSFQSAIPSYATKTVGGSPAVNWQASPAPAYLVAVANADGVRLKTIATR